MAAAYANNFEFARGYVSVGERSNVANAIRNLHGAVVQANQDLATKDLVLRNTLTSLTLTANDKKKLEDALIISENKTAEATAKIDKATNDMNAAFDAIFKLIVINKEAQDKMLAIEVKKTADASAVFSNMFTKLQLGDSPQAARIQNLLEATIPGNSNLLANVKPEDDEESA